MPTFLRTIIVEKPWGRTDIPQEYGDFGTRRVGEIWFAPPEGAPSSIMVKFLFTSDRLSIQVHPDDTAAHAAGYPRGKEECWLVLNAEPGAELGVGLTQNATKEQLHEAALSGAIVDMLDWRAARPGDFVYNRPGIIHAIGAGLTLVEVQQNVDCTYRLYDFGRPRPLHLEEGLAVATLAPQPDPRDTHVDRSKSRFLVEEGPFNLLYLTGADSYTSLPERRAEFIFTPLSAGCGIDGQPIHLGQCVLVNQTQGISLAPDASALLAWPH